MRAWYAYLWVSYLTKIEDKNITSDKHHHMLSLLSGKRGQEISTRDCWCGGSCWCHNQVCLFVFLCFVLLKSSTHLVVSLPGRNKEKMLYFFAWLSLSLTCYYCRQSYKLMLPRASELFPLDFKFATPVTHLPQNRSPTIFTRIEQLIEDGQISKLNTKKRPIENWSHVCPRNEQPHLPHYCNTLLFFKSTIQY